VPRQLTFHTGNDEVVGCTRDSQQVIVDVEKVTNEVDSFDISPSARRTPGSGVWTVAGENMENYGVPPDVYVDNTPADFLQGRDAQIEKAVAVLKEELSKKPTTSSR